MTKVPYIVTPPPGPKSRALLKERGGYVPPGVYLVQPVSITESSGSVIKDVDSNFYIDSRARLNILEGTIKEAD